MISCYERCLFEQQTPYLQWLREREHKEKVTDIDKKGKHVIKLPFLSCEESLANVMRQAGFGAGREVEILKETDVILFYGADGILDKNAEYLFAEYFEQHPQEALVYADEDYLGSLQEIYGKQVKENDIAGEYQYENTGLYRGFPWFKPDYSPDTFWSFFYVGNIFAVRGYILAELLDMWKQKGKEEQTGSIYEAVLRIVDKVKHAGHISEVLYTNNKLGDRENLPGTDELSMKMKKHLANEIKMQEDASRKVIHSDFIEENEIKIANVSTKQKIQMLCYPIFTNEMVSIIIPSKDNSTILKRCLATLVEQTDYPHYEIVIVDNGSSKEEQKCIRSYIAEIEEDYDLKWANDDEPVEALDIQYIYQKAEFNFSRMCNLGARASKGQYLLFLNDDMEVIESFWMRNMLGQAQMPHVGAVGAKLYYPKGETEHFYRIQHAGITNMGIGPAHKLARVEDKENYYHGHNLVTYNMIAVTAACLMVKRERFLEVGGFDEELSVAYNDVELCFKLYEKGYYNVQRNDAVLLHHESLSRGQDTSPENAKRLEREKKLLYQKHPDLKARDPFYSEHLVQWKKDVDYTCNYAYSYDKVVKPILLGEDIKKRVPKEHQNKFIRRLTGENLFMFQIDSVENLADEDRLMIRGWFVMRERDNAEIEKQMLLQNIENGEMYQFVCYPQLRYDVDSLFDKEASGLQGKTKNTALAGIHVLLDRNTLAAGTYRIGVLIKEKKGLAAGKICWNKDYEITIGL